MTRERSQRLRRRTDALSDLLRLFAEPTRIAILVWSSNPCAAPYSRGTPLAQDRSREAGFTPIVLSFSAPYPDQISEPMPQLARGRHWVVATVHRADREGLDRRLIAREVDANESPTITGRSPV
jgi:hypothetical protein